VDGEPDVMGALQVNVDSLPSIETPPNGLLIEHVNQFLPYADIQCANSSENGKTALATVHFRERPPGTLGRTFMIALILLLPLALVAVIFRGIFSGDHSVDSELPALLVGAPGVAAFALGPHGDGRSLSATPLFSYVGRLATALFATFAALDILATEVVLHHTVFHHTPISLSAITVGWAVMIGLAAMQLSLCCLLHFRYRMAKSYLSVNGISGFKPRRYEKVVLKLMGRRISRLLLADQ
jgi:hypothetical protein